jgi:hypothetical protein
MATPAPESPSFITLCLTSLSSPSALNSNTIHRQASGIFNTISLIRRDIDVSKSLLFPLIRAKAILPYAQTFAENVIDDTERALQNAQLLVEPLRLDQAEKGRFTWGNRARWAAMDKRKLHQTMGILLSRHQMLSRTISDLQHMTSRAGQQEEYAYMAPAGSTLSRESPTYAPTSPRHGDGSYSDQASLTERYSYNQDQTSNMTHAAAPVTYAPSSLVEWKRKGRQSVSAQAEQVLELSPQLQHAPYAPSSLVEWKRKSRQSGYSQDEQILELSPQLQHAHTAHKELYKSLDQRYDNTSGLSSTINEPYKPPDLRHDNIIQGTPTGVLRYKQPEQRLDNIWELGPPESNPNKPPDHDFRQISELSSERIRRFEHRSPNLDETYLDYSGISSTHDSYLAAPQPRVELSYTISSQASGTTQGDYGISQVPGEPSHGRHQSLVFQPSSQQPPDPNQGASGCNAWGSSQGSNIYTYPTGVNTNVSRQTWDGASAPWQGQNQ